MTYQLGLNANININELLRQCGLSLDGHLAISEDQNAEGGRFISIMGGGRLVSAYYHPSRVHTATVYRVLELQDLQHNQAIGQLLLSIKLGSAIEHIGTLYKNNIFYNMIKTKSII